MIIGEAMKAYMNFGKSPDIFYWRSHDGLEVDLILEAQGKLVPVEIKLTSTPTVKHTMPLRRFKKIVGKDAHEIGLLICNVGKPTPLPQGNLALPWREFYEYVCRVIMD